MLPNVRGRHGQRISNLLSTGPVSIQDCSSSRSFASGGKVLKQAAEVSSCGNFLHLSGYRGVLGWLLEDVADVWWIARFSASRDSLLANGRLECGQELCQ